MLHERNKRSQCVNHQSQPFLNNLQVIYNEPYVGECCDNNPSCCPFDLTSRFTRLRRSPLDIAPVHFTKSHTSNQNLSLSICELAIA